MTDETWESRRHQIHWTRAANRALNLKDSTFEFKDSTFEFKDSMFE
ncbi:hypothetical protein H6G93_01995 [Nostoc sp. FACHB-973]|nr:hypothetical protein [Nostoc sp. FACHB-973]